MAAMRDEKIITDAAECACEWTKFIIFGGCLFTGLFIVIFDLGRVFRCRLVSIIGKMKLDDALFYGYFNGFYSISFKKSYTFLQCIITSEYFLHIYNHPSTN